MSPFPFPFNLPSHFIFPLSFPVGYLLYLSIFFSFSYISSSSFFPYIFNFFCSFFLFFQFKSFLMYLPVILPFPFSTLYIPFSFSSFIYLSFSISSFSSLQFLPFPSILSFFFLNSFTPSFSIIFSSPLRNHFVPSSPFPTHISYKENSQKQEKNKNFQLSFQAYFLALLS